jgi:hypothetical protein
MRDGEAGMLLSTLTYAPRPRAEQRRVMRQMLEMEAQHLAKEVRDAQYTATRFPSEEASERVAQRQAAESRVAKLRTECLAILDRMDRR